MSDKQSTILVVFANPRGSNALQLGAEDRAIREAIRRSKFRDNINVQVLHATTVHDLRRALLDDDYRIVQVSGHGTGIGLLLEDELGGRYIVPQQALANLFSAYSHPKGTVECVILNACYSLTQGRLTSLGVPYTVAMEGPISDSAAIEFSRGFYDAIGAGRDIEFAYEEGCRAVDLAAPNTRWNSKFLRQGDVYEAEYAESDVESQSNVSRDLKDLRALVGLAVDLSGSMSQSIKNNTGGQLSRLESFRQSVERLVKEARNKIKESEYERVETSLDLFAYGFGLRDLDVCDLLSLMKVGKHVITKEEIEELKDRYAREMRSRYSGYEGLGGIARQFGLGDLVRQAEGAVRASAEAEIRRKIMLEVKRRIENQLDAVGDTTLPVEEVAKLWDSSGETLGNAEELIFGMTPMKQALNLVVERFRRELTNRPKGTQAVLFILSDGDPTDGDPRLASESLRAMGITIISCFVTDQDIADPRTLYSNPEPDWNNGARLMFDMASIVDDESNFARFLLKKGWTIGQDAKLFVQINYSEVLEEFIRVVISPLEERQEYATLPRGV